MFFATLNEYFDPISKGRPLKNNWKKNEEYKTTHFGIKYLKLKYFLKTFLASLLQESSTRTGTSSEVKKTIHSNGIRNIYKQALLSNLAFLAASLEGLSVTGWGVLFTGFFNIIC